MDRTIAVFGASSTSPGDSAYDEGIACGRMLAQHGFAVATGGYGGTMEAVSQGARMAGGRVIGVTAPSVFPGRSGANDHVTDEVPARSLVERIDLLTADAAGIIALEGSLGTAAELIVAWNIAFIQRFSDGTPKPVVAVGSPWRDLVPHISSSLDTDPAVVDVVDSADEAVRIMVDRLA